MRKGSRIYDPCDRAHKPESSTAFRDNSSASGACAPDVIEDEQDPFPTDALPSEVADFVREVTRIQHVPLGLVGVCAISVLAAALGAMPSGNSFVGGS